MNTYPIETRFPYSIATHTYIFIFTCTYIHTYMHIHTYSHAHTHIHTYIHTYIRVPCFLPAEAPDSPENISFTPMYGVLDVTATTVEWSYPEDGAEVNEYTVTVTDDDAIVQVHTTSDTVVSLSSLSYDTMLTLNITATNCIGSSTAAFANFSEGKYPIISTCVVSVIIDRM